MSGKKFTLETHCRVYDDENGQYLTVRPSPDAPTHVCLRTDQSEEEYSGKLDITIPPGMARKLAEALLKVAEEVEKN